MAEMKQPASAGIDTPQMKTGRVEELDGLRGCAAAAVFLCHATSLAPADWVREVVRSPILAPLYASAALVYLLFVLSGFVLSLPFLDGGERLSFPRFLVNRLFRIYPVFWVALIVGIGCLWLYAPARLIGLVPWIDEISRGGIGTLQPAEVLRFAALLFHTDPSDIDPSCWSLAVEVRMSILLPFVIWLLGQRRSATFTGGVLLASYGAACWPPLFFAPMFVIGAAAAKHRASLTDVVAHLPAGRMGLLAAAALPLWTTMYFVHGGPMQWIARQSVSIASIVLILAAMTRPRLRTFLLSPIVHGFGRTSYGFYLLHWPILLVAISWLMPLIGYWPSIAISSAITWLASAIVARFIERPCIRLGHRIAGRLGGSAIASARGLGDMPPARST